MAHGGVGPLGRAEAEERGGGMGAKAPATSAAIPESRPIPRSHSIGTVDKFWARLRGLSTWLHMVTVSVTYGHSLCTYSYRPDCEG